MQGLALLAPLVFGSCVADSVSIRILCNVEPETDCTYQVSGLCKLGGALNLSVGRGYFATLRVANGLKPRNSDVPPQSEPNGIQVNEMEVEVLNSAGKRISFGANVPNPYTVSATGFIDPSEEQVVGVTLIPVPYVRRLATMSGVSGTQIRLSVTARGKTAGDVDVESGEWGWTIDVYNTDLAGGQCVISDDEVCLWGQDSFVGSCSPGTEAP